MRTIHRSIGLLCAVLFAPSIQAETTLDWEPEKTWVFVVGLLEWEHSEIYASFPEAMKDRRDEQLVRFFQKSGVPGEQITYLQDKQATKKRIEKEFVKLLDQTDENDLLIFYFCGHGSRDHGSKQTWFANYDAGDEDDSAWNVKQIFKTIENHFSGSRALLLADCCHSGALYDEAKRRADSDIAYAVITSSYSHNTSTGRWTFSDALLSGLRGEGLVDLNGDHVIDFQELARFNELELAFLEGQKSMAHATDEFPRRAKISPSEGQVPPRIGQRLEVLYKGKWYKAKSIDADGDQLKVHYANYQDSWDEWVGPERVRPYQPAQFAQGDKVDVLWDRDGKWYHATVRDAWYGLHLIKYDDDSSEDEWVGPQAIRLRQK